MHCERLQHLLRRGGLRVGLRGRLRRCSRWLGRFGRRKIGASEVCVIQSSAKEINALHLRILQHETSHTRKASDERAGASGAGRGFEACGVTRPSSPACTRTYSTRHRRHARRQMNEPALEWEGAVVRGLWGHSASIPCMFAFLQHKTSQAREASDEGAYASGAGRGFEACGVTGLPSSACSHPCNTRHRTHARRQ